MNTLKAVTAAPACDDADFEVDESGSTVWQTAPKELWLQIDMDGDDYSQPFPDPYHDVSWCAESMGGVEVRYVRDDLCKQECRGQIATSRVIAAIQSAADSLTAPDKLTPARAEYWKAGARAAIHAFNAALRGTESAE